MHRPLQFYGELLAAFVLFLPLYVYLAMKLVSHRFRLLLLIALALVFILLILVILLLIYGKDKGKGLATRLYSYFTSSIVIGKLAKDENNKQALLLALITIPFSFPFFIIARHKKLFSLELEKQNNPHVLITGSSGTGKSSLCRRIVKELLDNGKANIVTLDIHDEYKDCFAGKGMIVDPNNISLNILDLDNTNPRHRAQEAINVILTVMPLGRIQQYYLEQAILDAYKRRGIFEDSPESWKKQHQYLRRFLSLYG